MSKRFQLGKLIFDSPLIQGPLAGYSCAAFRKLVWHFSGVAYCTTEMLSAHNIVHRPDQPKRYRYRDPCEQVLCVQLAGRDASILAKATEIVAGWGADLIDLNCGCPQPKIRKKGLGSKLLANPENLYHCVAAMRQACDRALTVKIRVDGESGEQFNREVMQALASAGADGIIVHGRHWTERYDVPARWDEIAALVKSVNIPVIANGDVSDIHSLQQIIDQTQCAAVMISRASLGKPWLFQQLQQQLAGHPVTKFSAQEQVELLLEHVTGLIDLESEYPAMLQARKLITYYFPDYQFSEQQLSEKNELIHLVQLKRLIASMA